MKISHSLEEAINEQIQKEIGAFYTYWAIACWFETTPYKGFASWMRKQSQEELTHAKKFHDYLLDRSGRVVLLPLTAPKVDFKDVLEAFEFSLKHEENVTQCIQNLYDMALRQKDYETQVFLQWFLTEQIEEEKTFKDVIEKLVACAGSTSCLFQMDAEAGKRS